MREVIALAEVQGVNLSLRDIEEWYGFLNSLSPQGKTCNVPNTVNQTLLYILRVLEQKGTVAGGGSRLR